VSDNLDPTKIGAAIADVQAEIGKREFLIRTLDEMKASQRTMIQFLEGTRLPALNDLLDEALTASADAVHPVDMLLASKSSWEDVEAAEAAQARTDVQP
jgi:hypothetical protein